MMSASSATTRGIELVKELQRGQGELTPYDTATVAATVDGVRALWDGINAAASAGDRDGGFVLQLTALREKACAVAYLRGRLAQIRRTRWELGAALPAELRERMSPEERAYFAGYSRAVARYAAALGGTFGVGVDVNAPPRELFVEVRGSVSAAAASSSSSAKEAYTESGPVSLDPNTVQYVRKDATVALLLRQGVLEQV